MKIFNYHYCTVVLTMHFYDMNGLNLHFLFHSKSLFVCCLFFYLLNIVVYMHALFKSYLQVLNTILKKPDTVLSHKNVHTNYISIRT